MKRSQAIFCASVAIVSTVFAQTTRPPLQPSAGMVSGIAPLAAADDQASTLASAQQTAQIFGLDRKIQRVRELQAERGAPSLTEEERSLRLELLESIQVAILDVDAVLGEISNERNQLGDLRASLQRRRDKSVGRFTTAALLTGSGVGIAVNATQYSSFSTRTNKFPDRFGCLQDSRAFCQSFFRWYNDEHRHSGVGLLTPATVHYGQAENILRRRQEVLDGAYQRHPERFVRSAPKPPPLPSEVWINRPALEPLTAAINSENPKCV